MPEIHLIVKKILMTIKKIINSTKNGLKEASNFIFIKNQGISLKYCKRTSRKRRKLVFF